MSMEGDISVVLDIRVARQIFEQLRKRFDQTAGNATLRGPAMPSQRAVCINFKCTGITATPSTCRQALELLCQRMQLMVSPYTVYHCAFGCLVLT